MLRFLCLTSLLFVTSAAFCQLPLLKWANAFNATHFGSRTYSSAAAVVVDDSGNVYSIGKFYETYDFDPGPGVYALTAQPFAINSIFISKLDSAGHFVWAKKLDIALEGWMDLAIDRYSNLYISSRINYPSDMDPGAGVHIITPIGAVDGFVVKLNKDGNFQWAKQFGGAGDVVVEANEIIVDRNGDVVIGGNFNDTVDFDPGPGIFNLTGPSIGAYVVKLTSTGDLLWAVRMGSATSLFHQTYIRGLECDPQNNILVSGYFCGTVDFNPGSSTVLMSANGYADGYLLKLSSTGHYVFARQFSNTAYNGTNMPRGMDVDILGNIVISGTCYGAQDFDPGTGTALAGGPGNHCFVVKVDAQGQFLWVKSFVSADGRDVATDHLNHIYLVGGFSSNSDLDPGTGVYQLNLGQYGATVQIKLDEQGNFVYAAPFLGYSNANEVTVDLQFNIHIVGGFASQVDFDPGPGVMFLTGSSNRDDIFVVKLAKCANPTFSNIRVISCSSYVLNNQVYDSSGIYFQVIPNATGCDSTIHLFLTIGRQNIFQDTAICFGDSILLEGSLQTQPGVYTDTLATTIGCDSIVTTRLRLFAKPELNLGADQSLCFGSNTSLHAGNFASYLWNNGATTASITTNTVGTYAVQVTDTNGCRKSDTARITAIYPLPKNFLPADTAICSYGTIELLPSTTYNRYLWSNSSASRSITITQPGVYWLEVTDANTCKGRDSIVVNPKDCLKGFYIPTAFTPNRDGRNDLFRPLLFGIVKQYRFIVFNRWGEIVYQTTELQKGWNGNVQGSTQDTGVFVWTCTYQLEGENVKTEKGTVTLIR